MSDHESPTVAKGCGQPEAQAVVRPGDGVGGGADAPALDHHDHHHDQAAGQPSAGWDEALVATPPAPATIHGGSLGAAGLKGESLQEAIPGRQISDRRSVLVSRSDGQDPPPAIELTERTIVALADAIASRLSQRHDGPGALLAVAEVARILGRSPAWVRRHRGELGQVMLGTGVRPRLLFDRECVLQVASRSESESSSATESPANPLKPTRRPRERSGTDAQLLPFPGSERLAGARSPQLPCRDKSTKG